MTIALVVVVLLIALVAVAAVIYVGWRVGKLEKLLNGFLELKKDLEETAKTLKAEKIIERFDRIEKRVNSNTQVFGRLTRIAQRFAEDVKELSKVLKNLSEERMDEEVPQAAEKKGDENGGK